MQLIIRKRFYQLPVTSYCPPSSLGVQPPFSAEREGVKERWRRREVDTEMDEAVGS